MVRILNAVPAGVVNVLPEDTDTAAGIKLADIVITDDGAGTNNLSLTGTDADQRARLDAASAPALLRAVAQAEMAVEQLGRHPSIAMWSAHNEPADTSIVPVVPSMAVP